MKHLLASLLILLSACIAQAEQLDSIVVRPVVSAFTAEIGGNYICDTYLTPLHYSGWQTAIGYERLQAMRFNPENWIMRLDGRVSLGRALSPSKNAEMWSVNFRPSWSMMWRTRPIEGLAVAIGGNIGAEIGCLYLPRNSNNPASTKASATIGVTAMAAYNTHLGRVPVTLRYQPTMPLTGVFFSPDYDELYYEIWLGNHSGLCHAAWPGNFFRLDNLVSADLRFGTTIVRLGYRCDIFSSKVSGITTRNIAHNFVIGFATEWLSLRPGSSHMPDAKTISALY